MPYIENNKRHHIDKCLKHFFDMIGLMEPGEFVYTMYQMAQWQASFGGTGHLPVGWGAASRVIADMECAKLEFYRRIVVPYENEKIEENGDCTPLRANSDPYLNYANLSKNSLIPVPKEKVKAERKIDPFDMARPEPRREGRPIDDVSSPQGDGANRPFDWEGGNF